MTYAQAQAIQEAHHLAADRLLRESEKLFATASMRTLPKNLDSDRDVKRWLDAMYLLGTRQANQASALAATGYKLYRDARGVSGTVTPVLAKPNRQAFEDAIRPTVLVPQWRALNKISALADGEEFLARSLQLTANRLSLVGGTGAFSKYVATAHRETTIATTQRDPRAVGWARATRTDACSFCLLLASQGPVFRSEQTAGFASHDLCGCKAAPSFDRDEPWNDTALSARALWDSLDPSLKGKDREIAFRQAVEGRKPTKRTATAKDAPAPRTGTGRNALDAVIGTSQLEKIHGELANSLAKFDSPGTRSRINEIEQELNARDKAA